MRIDDGHMNDELIQFWMNWILFSFNVDESPVYCCKTFMYSKLTGQHELQPSLNYERVKTWCNKNLFDKLLVFVPLYDDVKRHWILAIIINPSSFVKGKKNFRIIICDSLITEKYHMNIKEKNQTIINNLTYWLREEWLFINMSRKAFSKRDVNVVEFEQFKYCPFFSSGQKNSFDCGIFLCAYAYETVQWLLDSDYMRQPKQLIDYLNKVNQNYVYELRTQIFELLIRLEWKQQFVKTVEEYSDDDDDEVVIIDPCEVSSIKTSNIKNGIKSATVVTESMVGLLNMKNVVTVLENNNSNNEHKQSEENLKVKEITMAVEEDDISSVL
jgi:hypothetical protein